MALITWTESYTVQVALFDQHHQHLFDLLNTLHESMREGRGSEVIDEIIDALVDYAGRHFAAEEEALYRTRYPAMNAHVLEHKKFHATVSRLQKQHRAGTHALSHEVVSFMQEWLKHHIARTDRAYGPHLLSHGVR
jgi:hemerythrin-like metal-binding protein